MSNRTCDIGISGFTLVEVLVAFVILAASLVVVFKALSGGMNASLRALPPVQMALEAQSLSERLGTDILLDEATNQTNFKLNNEWAVLMEVDKRSYATQPANNGWSLYRVRLVGRSSDGTVAHYSTSRVGR